MALRIQNNVEAFNAHRNLSWTEKKMGTSMERLSSGYRINRAADDAAGLVISENLRSQVGGLRVATRNAQDGISVVQTAEGALTEVHSMLQRMRELVLQASNGSSDSDAKTAIDSEMDALVAEITRVGDSTRFGNTTLLAGTSSMTFQVGSTANDTITVSFSDMRSTAIGQSTTQTLSTVDVTSGTQTTAQRLTIIDEAIGDVSTLRGQLGAAQNRLEHTVANLSVAVENLAASESRIRDADMASEMVQFTRHQIMLQAGTAMLAQANAAPQSVLGLLQ